MKEMIIQQIRKEMIYSYRRKNYYIYIYKERERVLDFFKTRPTENASMFIKLSNWSADH